MVITMKQSTMSLCQHTHNGQQFPTMQAKTKQVKPSLKAKLSTDHGADKNTQKHDLYL